MLGDKYFWNLHIHFHPHVPDGVRPTVGKGLGERCEGDYKPYTLRFNQPPTAVDFLKVVNRLPWAQFAFTQERDGVTLLQSIDQSEWPIVDFTHKASEVELLHNGRVVGHLRVDRDDVFIADSYDRYACMPTSDSLNLLVCRLTDKDEAKRYAWKHENAARQLMISGSTSKEAWRSVLIKGGFLKNKKKSVAR